MKIAVAILEEQVSAHFGQSEGFLLFEKKENEVQALGFLERPEREKGSLPGLLLKEKVSVLLTGGLGEGAVKKLEAGNIEVISGVQGDPEAALKAYVAGELLSTGVPCAGHDHEEGHAHHCRNHQ
ncbi:MAG TPA: dinitrogenase iron-molybdenum cofactor [Clostridiaceae bacterium]|nr:dinitrogenase iron-molybdenum cofactor [Clostridiaceae bacterium]